jgi:AICAR transformylase/IMP cyclohydrolase PurH
MTKEEVDVSGSWAMFSVFSPEDKVRAIAAARRLHGIGRKILSAGGTCTKIAEAGTPVLDLKVITGGGEALSHNVLTLSRELYMGLLSDLSNQEHLAELKRAHVPLIDFVYCTFYDTKRFIREAVAIENRLERLAFVAKNTDVGGPCMVHAAAKGFRIVVCNEADLEEVLVELERTGDVSAEHRQRLRATAEETVLRYQALVAAYQSEGRLSIDIKSLPA